MRLAKWIVASSLGVLIALSLISGIYVFDSAIRSKLHSGAPNEPHDPVGQTMQAYTQFGDQWLTGPT